MTLTRLTIFATAISLCGLAAHALPVNITIPDPHTDKGFTTEGGTVPQNGEDNEVEFNSVVAAQDWDLEKFELDNVSITGTTVSTGELRMTAGVNFDTGANLASTGQNFEMGDIFIYLNTGVPYANDPEIWTGKEQWSYVVRFDRDNVGANFDVSGGKVGYKVLKKSASFDQSDIAETGGGNHLFANLPLRVAEGSNFNPNPVSSGGDVLTSGLATYSAAGLGDTFHNTVSGINVKTILQEIIDTGTTGNPFDAYLHTTIKCGNDVMWGGSKATTFTISVPDGGMTLVMLGAGLTGLGLLRRRLS